MPLGDSDHRSFRHDGEHLHQFGQEVLVLVGELLPRALRSEVDRPNRYVLHPHGPWFRVLRHVVGRPPVLVAHRGRHEVGLRALLRWPKPGRGGPTPSDEYQITRASSANASASWAEGGTSVPRS